MASDVAAPTKPDAVQAPPIFRVNPLTRPPPRGEGSGRTALGHRVHQFGLAGGRVLRGREITLSAFAPHPEVSEKALRPMSPRRISAREQIRPIFVLSPKNTIPTTVVPAVPIPAKAA